MANTPQRNPVLMLSTTAAEQHRSCGHFLIAVGDAGRLRPERQKTKQAYSRASLKASLWWECLQVDDGIDQHRYARGGN